MSLVEIQNTVSNLSEHERGSLAAWLLDSLPPHGEEDASLEGLNEAVRRRQELKAGNVRPLSASEFWEAIDRERSTWK